MASKGAENLATKIQKAIDSPSGIDKVLEASAVPAAALMTRFEERPENVKSYEIQDLNENLRQGTPEELINVGNMLRNQYGESGTKYANMLDQAANGNKRTKNVMLFKLLQNPEFRQMMRGEYDSTQ